jgi:hypothetical protein
MKLSKKMKSMIVNQPIKNMRNWQVDIVKISTIILKMDEGLYTTNDEEVMVFNLLTIADIPDDMFEEALEYGRYAKDKK